MATGAELAAKYGTRDAGYNNFLSWIQAGAKHPSWAAGAEAAAAAAGIPRVVGIDDALVDTPGAYRIEERDWGEQKKYNAATGAEIYRNPAWLAFVQKWTADNPGVGGIVNTAPQPPVASARLIEPMAKTLADDFDAPRGNRLVLGGTHPAGPQMPAYSGPQASNSTMSPDPLQEFLRLAAGQHPRKRPPRHAGRVVDGLIGQ